MKLNPQKNDYRGLLQFPFELITSEEKKWKDVDFSKTITIAPGSSSRRKNKRWPKKQFAKLIDELTKQNFTIYITGSHQEHSINKSIINLTESKMAKNLAGKLTLTQLAYLLSKTRLLICNDSGSMHLASVFETPLIAIFGPTSPADTGPYNKNSHVIHTPNLKKLSHHKVLEAVKREF